MAEQEENKETTTSRKVLMIFIYVVLMLVAAEIFYNFFWKDPPMTEVVKGNHPTFHHVPNSFLTSGLGEYDFRGNKYKIEKAPDTIRIAFIGDSFTYGFTAHDQTIPHHLKKVLKEKLPEQKFEVLNFGFVSYSPLIEEIVYKQLVKPLKPDYVIQLYDSFDPQDDVLYAKSATFDENGSPISIAGEEFLKTGIRRSALVRFIQFSYDVMRNGWHYLPIEQRFESRAMYIVDPQTFQFVIDYSFDTIKRLTNTVTKDGSKMLLFQYPPPHTLKKRYEFANYLAGFMLPPNWDPPEKSKFAELFLAFCEKEKFNCSDFGPEVRKMEQEIGSGSMLKIYNNRDGHFTGFANLRFAEFIFDKLKKDGLVKSEK